MFFFVSKWPKTFKPQNLKLQPFFSFFLLFLDLEVRVARRWRRCFPPVLYLALVQRRTQSNLVMWRSDSFLLASVEVAVAMEVFAEWMVWIFITWYPSFDSRASWMPLSYSWYVICINVSKTLFHVARMKWFPWVGVWRPTSFPPLAAPWSCAVLWVVCIRTMLFDMFWLHTPSDLLWH